MAEMATSCHAEITVKQALAMRDLGIKLKFLCVSCGRSVKAVRQGKGPEGIKVAAHFAHNQRNKSCPMGIGEELRT